MSQKYKHIASPLAKKAETKTDRMKKYGKTVVNLKNAKFEDDLSEDSQKAKRNSKYKTRESIS